MSTLALMSNSELVGIAEAAEILAESRQQTARRVASGQLPARRVGSGPKAAHVIELADVHAVRETIAAELADKLARLQGATA